MAADVAKFSAAIDKVHKTFSTQEVWLDQAEMKGLSSRGIKQYTEQKFQQHLQRARAAFLREFRNHSVVVESEVRKIREELTLRFEEKYGERIAQLKAEAEGHVSLVQKLQEDLLKLRTQKEQMETYIAEVRPRLEVEEKLRKEISQVRGELSEAKSENADYALCLKRRDELVSHLTNELRALQAQTKRQSAAFADERRGHEELARGLHKEMQQQQEQFQAHLQSYEESFAEYRTKAAQELQIQEILNKRRSEALDNMETERQRHLKARTKPTVRIGAGMAADGEEQSALSRDLATGDEWLSSEEEYGEEYCADYELAANARYRVDDMGMDTAWRDYALSNTGGYLQQPLPAIMPPPGASAATAAKRSSAPKFRAERLRKAALRANLDPVPPTATDNTPRPFGGSGPLLQAREIQAADAIPLPTSRVNGPQPRSAR